MTPTITAALVVSVLALGGSGITAWTTLNSNVTGNTTLIEANSVLENERQDNLKYDLEELKENDKEIQRLLRKLLEQQNV
jgi:uncharacterized protein HemX